MRNDYPKKSFSKAAPYSYFSLSRFGNDFIVGVDLRRHCCGNHNYFCDSL